MRTRLPPMAAIGLVLLLSAGCAIDDPYDNKSQRPPAGAPPAARASTGNDRRLPQGEEAALEAFAAAWIEWTSSGSPEVRAELRALAASALERELLGGARRGRRVVPASRTFGRVEGVLRTGDGRTLVVTHVRTRFDAGGAQAQYGVYVARAERLERIWEVVQWQPVL